MGLAEAAGAQRGLVTRSQLVGLGFSPKAIEHRVAIGALHRVHRGVFAVGTPVLQPLGAETAGLLYAGDDAVLSHESAAALWGLATHPSFVVITMIGRHARAQPGLRIHEVKALDLRDVSIHQGFPVTSPARTVIDCAARGDIEDMLNEARAQKLVTDDALHAAIARCPTRAGTRAVRHMLAAEQDTGYDQSRAERLLKRLIRAADLERAVHNVKIEAKRVDAFWPRHNLVLEVDGHKWHGHRQAFERDRARDQKLVAAGYAVIRVTWRQLTEQPMMVMARIAQALARRDPT
jgi:very-short-patch-repair endonuclease